MTSPDARINRWLPLFLALFGVAAGLTLLFFLNHRFFFMDDRQAQYFPYGLLIKEQLLNGEFPFLTTRTFYGGALWLDWQYGIYNPLSLLMDLMIMPQHLELSGFLFALVSNLLLTVAAYVLGRAYDLRPAWAALMGLLMGLNIYIVYRCANIWHPGVTSLAWLLFSWAALKKLLEAERYIAGHALVVALLVYLMISAGWPHCDIAFAIITGALFVQSWRQEKGRALRLVPAGLLAAAFSLPVLLPPLLAFSWTARGAVPPTTLFHPAIFDFANVSNPVWWPFMTDGQPGPQPMLYLCWFALPILFLVDWDKLRRKHLLLLAVLMEIFFLCAASGFGLSLLLRYPIRWIPYLFTPSLLALLLAVQEEKWSFTPARLRQGTAAFVLPILAAFILRPHLPLAAWAVAGAGLLALGIFFLQAKWGKLRHVPAFFGISSFAITTLIFIAVPVNLDAVDWNKADQTAIAAPPASTNVTYTLASAKGTFIPKGTRDEREFPIAAMGAYYGLNTINGYSSIGQRGLEKTLHCTQYSFILCALPPETLLAKEPETGVSYLDLFKVNRILVEMGDLSARMEAQHLHGWKEKALQNAVEFERQKKIDLPGTLSWRPADLIVASPSAAGGSDETLTLEKGTHPGLLVFARLFYPGFHATLNGAPLNVRPVNDMLVGVEVPARAEGVMRLSFLPPGFIPCAIIALFALAGAIILALRERMRGF